MIMTRRISAAAFGAVSGAGVMPALAQSAPVLPSHLSPWGMFMGADIVVKTVMIGLAFASVLTWTIWVYKLVELRSARSRVIKAGQRLAKARSLREAVDAVGPKTGSVGQMVSAAAEEVAMSTPLDGVNDGSGLKERVASRMERLETQAGRRMTLGTGLIATIGSTAPFVGLFGTVWGIMNAFVGISEAQTTNLAIVAPGIAESLLATAIGLVAAIPAVVIYNAFARSISGYRLLLGDASATIGRLVSRDIDLHQTRSFKAAAE